MSKNILFTGFYFDGYHGSVIHILEIAEYLTNKGYKCYCASVSISEELKNIAQQRLLSVYNIYDLPINIKYDIVWSYHFPLLAFLLKKGLKYKKIHIGCLSSYASLEFFPIYYKDCSLCTVVSEEVKDVLANEYKFDRNRILVFPNFLPDKFCKFNYINHKKSLKRIIVVSNHVPEEIKSLPNYLHNISVDYFGMSNSSYQLITPEILSEYDVVISIGKTVQYALGMGIPVFEYDHFGGCGYITLKNYRGEEYYNYSGRKTKRKLSSKEIADELVTKYEKAIQQSEKLKQIAINRYLLSKQVDNILEEISKKETQNIMASPVNRLFMSYSECFINYTNMYIKNINLAKLTNNLNNRNEYSLFGFIPLLKIKQSDLTTKMYFCGIPIFKIKIKNKESFQKIKYYILGILILQKIKSY